MNIYATEMTVATGTVTYGGDPDDERIRSREVRVSVTYRIEDPETNLADLAHAKAAEVEGARMAAAGRIERDRADATDADLDPDDPRLVRPDADPEDGYGPEGRNDAAPEEGREAHEGEEYDEEEGCIGPRYEGPRAWRPPLPTGGAASPETDWATRPQVLAIGSHFKRLGISSQEQTALLRARFGKFRAERLTKDEAAGLMRSLERGEVDSEPVGSATGNLDGRCVTATRA